MGRLTDIEAITFDLFGTVLDLAGSLTPFVSKFLVSKDVDLSADEFFRQWRYRQRIEQYQDNIVMMGHSGYLPVARRACVYTLKQYKIAASEEEVDELMEGWQALIPFPDVIPALGRLRPRFRLVVLSNGEPAFLEHLTKNCIGWDFDEIISVQEVGAFKPHPAVYRKAAQILALEVGQCLMVSSNSFDPMGARMCGYRGAYINRYELPYEDTPYLPDIEVRDFAELADVLL